MKTNAARLLDTLNIRYELRSYPVDPDDLSAAEKVGLPPGQLFKTLVCRPGRPDGRLSGRGSGRSRGRSQGARPRPGRPALRDGATFGGPAVAGYVRGGVTALAAKREYPVVLDTSALDWPIISVSAGIRGGQLLLAPADYQRVVKAELAPLTRAGS